MSWDNFEPQELKALRNLLCISTKEAGELIAKITGKHPARSWQRWESGVHKVPDDINHEMYALCSLRAECIEGMALAEEDERKIKFYPTFESFAVDFPNQNIIWWRIHQSVCSAIFIESSDVELAVDMETDKDTYIYKLFSKIRDEDVKWQKQEEKAKELGID